MINFFIITAVKIKNNLKIFLFKEASIFSKYYGDNTSPIAPNMSIIGTVSQ